MSAPPSPLGCQHGAQRQGPHRRSAEVEQMNKRAKKQERRHCSTAAELRCSGRSVPPTGSLPPPAWWPRLQWGLTHLQDEQHLDNGRGRLGPGQQQQITQLHLEQDQVAEAQQGDLADGQLLALERREGAGLGGESPPDMPPKTRSPGQPGWTEHQDGKGRGVCRTRGGRGAAKESKTWLCPSQGKLHLR